MHVQSLLEQAGVNVALAIDGPEGVTLAQTVRPDLIVLDMQLPGMNGLQVCKRLKRAPDTRHIPVVLFTRHDDPEIVALGLESGVIGCIPKDAFADAVLLETLRQLHILAEAHSIGE